MTRQRLVRSAAAWVPQINIVARRFQVAGHLQMAFEFRVNATGDIAMKCRVSFGGSKGPAIARSGHKVRQRRSWRLRSRCRGMRNLLASASSRGLEPRTLPSTSPGRRVLRHKRSLPTMPRGIRSLLRPPARRLLRRGAEAPGAERSMRRTQPPLQRQSSICSSGCSSRVLRQGVDGASVHPHVT